MHGGQESLRAVGMVRKNLAPRLAPRVGALMSPNCRMCRPPPACKDQGGEKGGGGGGDGSGLMLAVDLKWAACI